MVSFSKIIVAILVIVAVSAPAPAQTLLSSGHVDMIDVTYQGPMFPQLAIGIHDHDNDVEYGTIGTPGATDWAKLVVVAAAIDTRPTAASFAPIGVPAGTDFWWLKNPQNVNTLFGGFAAEEIVPTNVIGSYFEADPRANGTARWIKLTLNAKTGPGEVSVWTESGGNPLFSWATSDGITTNDIAFITAGGHKDYNFGFTAPGEYTLDVTASAFDSAMMPIASEVTTLQFQVVPVPEPALLLFGMLVLPLALRTKTGKD